MDGDRGSCPVELLNDGDLILLIDRMLERRGRGTVRITKFKGHAEEDMVVDGRVRELDRIGNDAADEAADFGRQRLSLMLGVTWLASVGVGMRLSWSCITSSLPGESG